MTALLAHVLLWLWGITTCALIVWSGVGREPRASPTSQIVMEELVAVDAQQFQVSEGSGPSSSGR
jgi:hypothetical protein